MKVTLEISTSNGRKILLDIELNDTNTAREIWKALPIESSASTWGDEIYFTVPVKLPDENPRSLVQKGDVAYWPPGKAVCVFFGPTPVSGPGEIRPYSPVNVIGKASGDLSILKSVKDADSVKLLSASEP